MLITPLRSEWQLNNWMECSWWGDGRQLGLMKTGCRFEWAKIVYSLALLWVGVTRFQSSHTKNEYKYLSLGTQHCQLNKLKTKHYTMTSLNTCFLFWTKCLSFLVDLQPFWLYQIKYTSWYIQSKHKTK